MSDYSYVRESELVCVRNMRARCLSVRRSDAELEVGVSSNKLSIDQHSG